MPLRSFALMMPAVTVALSPNGLPMAENPVADVHAVGISKLGYRQFLAGFDLDYSQVGVFIHADDFRGVLGRIAIQLNLNFRRLLDDVVVGQHIAALIDDHARAQAAFGLRRCILPAVKEPVEEVLHRVIAFTLTLRRRAALRA